MEIKSYLSLQMELYLPMPADIEVGDTFTIQRGCDKTAETCINVYNNIVNRRGARLVRPGPVRDFEGRKEIRNAMRRLPESPPRGHQ